LNTKEESYCSICWQLFGYDPIVYWDFKEQSNNTSTDCNRNKRTNWRSTNAEENHL